MEEFKKLTDREHILLRPSMYIGKTVPETVSRFIDGIKKEVTITPGLLKISNELIDNSVDEFIRSERKYADKILIDINNNSLKVKDNGRGIPITKYNNEWRPKVAWCEAKSGTSFSENRIGPGANGVGSVVANVFSKLFIGITCDGNNYCRVTSSNNMSDVSVSVMKSKAQYTEVEIIPDFNRFGVEEYTDDHILMIKERIKLLSATYPEIMFIFNGEPIKYKNTSKYFDIYGDIYYSYTSDNFSMALYPSNEDDYIHRTAIDGLDMILGGTHEQLIMRELSNSLRELIKKKYKFEMTISEIKRGFKLVFIGRNFPNMEFESQTKERLTNSEKTVKEWLGDIPYDNIAKKIMNIPEIINPIIEAKLAKQLAQEKRAVTLALKKNAKKHILKHLEAKSKNKNEKVLFLCEGDSASGNGIKVRNPQKHGFFPLRGIPMNIYGVSQKDILDNKELSSIMSILNLSFDMKTEEIDEKIEYGRIGILADSDEDGSGAIVPLLLNFFYLWKHLYEKERIYIIPSPRYVLTKGKGENRKVIYFYSKEEYEQERNKYKGYETRYIKGLATLRDYEYEEVISNEEKWIKVVIDNPDCFKIMYSDDVTSRKNIMMN